MLIFTVDFLTLVKISDVLHDLWDEIAKFGWTLVFTPIFFFLRCTRVDPFSESFITKYSPHSNIATIQGAKKVLQNGSVALQNRSGAGIQAKILLCDRKLIFFGTVSTAKIHRNLL